MTLSQKEAVFRQSILWCTLLIISAGFFTFGYWQGKRVDPSDTKLHLPISATDSSQSLLAIPTGTHSFSSIPEPPISPNASPEMKEFLQNRATLTEKRELMRTESTNGVPNPEAFVQFQKDNAELLKRQQDLAQIISQQEAKNPLLTPLLLQIPANASTTMKAFLTTRDQLMRDQIAFMNKHRGDDPTKREAAMQQWRQQNAPRFQQLQQEAQALAQSNPNAGTK